MAKLRRRLGLKYLHKTQQSPPTNKNRFTKINTKKNVVKLAKTTKEHSDILN